MINKSVWATFGNTLRLGTVLEEKKENGWTFVKVDWKDDENFDYDKRRLEKLRNLTNHYSDWYRVDKINFFDKEKMINTISKL